MAAVVDLPMDSPNASSDSATLGLSPSHSHLNQARKRKYSHLTDERPAREYGLMRDAGKNDTARFIGSGSGIHFIRNVYLRLARKSASRSSGATGNDINHLVPGEDDQLQPGQDSSRDGTSDQALWRDHEIALETESAESRPSFEQLVGWSKSYFETWHPTLPFLSAPEVLALLEKVSDDGITSLGHLDQSIVRSVLSISLADSRQSRPFSQAPPASLFFLTIQEAMSASQFALYQPASLKATQTALAIQVFLVSMLRLNAASRLGGLIVRMAFHLGLHRCPTRYPFFTKPQASVRRRVFWSLYIIERFLAQSLGLPLDIRDDDVDVCYPGEEKHSADGLPETQDNRLQLLTFHAKHARIRGLILELRNKSIHSRDDSLNHEKEVQAELARWTNDIHDAVEDEDEPGAGEGDGPTDPHSLPPLSSGQRVLLLVLKFESKISLNRPMMASDPSNSSYCAGLQNCIFAAKSILLSLKKHQKQNQLAENPHSSREPIVWPSVTWAIWISAFILIYAASEKQIPLASALRQVEAGKDMLRHLSARETAWPEYCLSAIDDLMAAVQDLTLPPTVAQPRKPPSGPQTNAPTTEQGRSVRSRSSLNTSAPRRSERQRTSFSASVGVSDGLPSAFSDGSPNSLPSTDNPSTNRQSDGQQHQGSTMSTKWPQNSFTHGLTPGPGTSQIDPNRPHQDSFGLSDRGAPLGMPVNSFGTFPGGETAALEGQEPMAWYDQLFANSLGALDYPFLAAAQSDPTVDPTWSYLR